LGPALEPEHDQRSRTDEAWHDLIAPSAAA